MTKFSVRLGIVPKIITVACFIIMSFALIKLTQVLLEGGFNIIYLSLIILLLISIVSPVFTMPVSIYALDDRLLLKKLLGSKTIFYSDIIVAERFSPKSDIRIFGSGGYWVFFGIFSNPRIGRYTAFVGDYKEAVLIQVAIAGGYKSYVVSCRNYDEFIMLANNNRDIRTILSATYPQVFTQSKPTLR